MKNISLEDYLNKTNINIPSLPNLSSIEKINLLKDIYFAHVKTFPYSNTALRSIARQHPIQRPKLSFFSYKNLLSSEPDGYCFQTAALLNDALEQLGYETVFCAARVLVGAPINSPAIMTLPATHLVLVVTIDEQKFLLDPGMGSSAPRFPILITGKSDSITQNEDEYKFYPTDGVHVLERKTSQGWLRLMQTDLEPISEKTAQFNLLKLQLHPDPIPIRDTKTVFGVITPNGRKTLIWDVQSNQLKFSKQDGAESIYKTLTSFEEGVQILAEEFDIPNMSAETLKIHCSQTVLPKPQKPWTVNFPLDEAELSKMAENLTFKV
ncbi:arylamine N-acetyltransferase [Legionella cardiaca]|uniref:Arylamine N-acetyltransferase n=1 Tax=Legionella cardiaca TaxID=1071983 RepID=A0ABY8APQ9_9GAMM|nr:arylamine N-acetyltransferase [Legionella cardiaca]WED42695.1 arylamine N-acetyltransferase [Legionella cardiaca]